MGFLTPRVPRTQTPTVRVPPPTLMTPQILAPDPPYAAAAGTSSITGGSSAASTDARMGSLATAARNFTASMARRPDERYRRTLIGG